MTRQKYDVVIEAAHYSTDGNIAFIRAYERKGFAFSDLVLLDRKTLLERLQNGKHFATGKRKHLLGGAFEVEKTVKCLMQNGKEIVTTGGQNRGHDLLEDVPIL